MVRQTGPDIRCRIHSDDEIFRAAFQGITTEDGYSPVWIGRQVFFTRWETGRDIRRAGQNKICSRCFPEEFFVPSLSSGPYVVPTEAMLGTIAIVVNLVDQRRRSEFVMRDSLIIRDSVMSACRSI
jgi:hypothetical protein